MYHAGTSSVMVSTRPNQTAALGKARWSPTSAAARSIGLGGFDIRKHVGRSSATVDGPVRSRARRGSTRLDERQRRSYVLDLYAVNRPHQER